MKKLVSLLLTGALAFGLLAGCGGGAGTAETPAGNTNTPSAETPSAETPAGETVTLRIGGTPAPHVEILEQVVPILAEQGITLDITTMNDYNTPTTRWRTAPWTPTTSSTSPT